MSNVLNRFLCVGQGVGNTGNPDCQFIPANIVGAILIPSGTTYTSTQAATIDTVLQAAAKADNPALRAYPIKRFVSMNDNSSEDTTSESGYGDITKMRSGKPVWQFEMRNGLYSWSQLLEFDNQESTWDVLFLDEQNNVIWGMSTENGGLKGFALNQLSLSTPKMNDGSNPFNYMLTFGLRSVRDLQRFALVQFDDSTDVVDMVDGLLTIKPQIVNVNTASDEVTVKLLSAGTDLYDLYSTEFGTTTLWSVTVNGATSAVSSSTANASTKDWTLSVGTINASEVVEVTLVAVSVLETNGVVGYEGDKASAIAP